MGIIEKALLYKAAEKALDSSKKEGISDSERKKDQENFDKQYQREHQKEDFEVHNLSYWRSKGIAKFFDELITGINENDRLKVEKYLGEKVKGSDPLFSQIKNPEKFSHMNNYFRLENIEYARNNIFFDKEKNEQKLSEYLKKREAEHTVETTERFKEELAELGLLNLDEAIAKNGDGKISAKDERHIKSEQKHARKKIYSATHNDETNPKK